MRTLLNLIWLVLAGLWLAIGYVLAGIVFCLLIITIPFGIASFRIAAYALWPFGRTVPDHRWYPARGRKHENDSGVTHASRARDRALAVAREQAA